MSHNRIKLSEPPDINEMPSGEKDIKLTLSLCPSNCNFSCFVFTSHNRIDLSALPAANIVPSGEKHTE